MTLAIEVQGPCAAQEQNQCVPFAQRVHRAKELCLSDRTQVDAEGGKRQHLGASPADQQPC